MRRQAVLTLLLASMTTVLCAARCGGDDKNKSDTAESDTSASDAPMPDEQLNLNDPMPSGEPDPTGLEGPSDSAPGGSVDQVPADEMDAQPSDPEPSADL